MGIFKNHLLVSDIDGTLLENGLIPKRNIEAIDYFTKESGKFSIASGRSIEAVRPIYKMSHCNAPGVTCNGAIIFDFDSDNAVWQTELTEAAKQIIEPIMNKFPSVGVEVHSGKKLYIVRNSREIEDHIAYEKITSENIDLADAKKLLWTKSILMTSDAETMKELQEFADSLLPNSEYFVRTGNPYYELTSIKANKAKGIEHLKDYLGKGYTVCAIGDYYNDIDMLKYADIACCVEDSPSEVKAVSDYVSCKCSDAAVADFIEYLANKLK